MHKHKISKQHKQRNHEFNKHLSKLTTNRLGEQQRNLNCANSLHLHMSRHKGIYMYSQRLYLAWTVPAHVPIEWGECNRQRHSLYFILYVLLVRLHLGAFALHLSSTTSGALQWIRRITNIVGRGFRHLSSTRSSNQCLSAQARKGFLWELRSLIW